MNANNEVLFEEIAGNGGNLGVITLNRPQALNALNHSMVISMHAQLKIWATAENIKAVVIRASEGRAFCAGGDLRSTHERYRDHDASLANFFRDEYQLNRTIFHFPKPYVALLDGITMGGGVGISIHGSHRVATDRLVFAMPETGIGFFPDVGGTYFLPRLPGRIGFYLGLTGARLASDECVAIGIAQLKVRSESLPELVNALAQHAFEGDDAREAVTQILRQFNVPVKRSQITDQQAILDDCFSGNTVEDIMLNLEDSASRLCQESAAAMTKKSPTSLKITLRALQEGRRMDFDACMRQEFRLVTRFLQGHDFAEGIRAVIIDKDQTPHWKPATIVDVTHEDIEKYFGPLTQELA